MNESKILLRRRRRAQALKAQAGALKVVSSATSRVTKLSKAVLPPPPLCLKKIKKAATHKSLSVSDATPLLAHFPKGQSSKSVQYQSHQGNSATQTPGLSSLCEELANFSLLPTVGASPSLGGLHTPMPFDGDKTPMPIDGDQTPRPSF